MKRTIPVFLALALAVLILSGCSPKANIAAGKQEKITYTCPMHTDVISDKSGPCPKCGMDLVRFSTKGTHNHKGCKMNSGGSHDHSGGGCGMM